MSAGHAGCDECKFWKRLTEDTKPGEYQELPGSGDDFADWGTCERQHQPGPTPIYSMDASDYSSWITTHKDFWCAEFAR